MDDRDRERVPEIEQSGLWRRPAGEDLASDLTLHDAKEAAERVAATLREHGFRFIRIKQERPKRGRWQR